MAEHDEQVALFTWAGYNLNKYPCLEFMYAIPNGGKRHINVAKKLKAEGVKAGVLDVFLPEPVGKYHGLYIEMKYGYNKMSDNQKNFAKMAQEKGYAVGLCYDWESAADLIQSYLNGKVIQKVEV